MTSRLAVCCVALALVAIACDGSEPPASNDTPERVSTPQVERTDAVAEEREELTGERQEASTFRPTISLRAPSSGDPVRVARETRHLLLLDGGQGFRILFSNPREVFTYESGSPRLADAPADLMSWVRSIPHLEVTEEGTRSGVPGRPAFIDAKVTSVVKKPGELCPIPCVPLVPLEVRDLAFALVDGQKARFFFYDDFFVVVGGPSDGFGKTVKRTEKLLQTVEL